MKYPSDTDVYTKAEEREYERKRKVVVDSAFKAARELEKVAGGKLAREISIKESAKGALCLRPWSSWGVSGWQGHITHPVANGEIVKNLFGWGSVKTREMYDCDLRRIIEFLLITPEEFSNWTKRLSR